MRRDTVPEGQSSEGGDVNVTDLRRDINTGLVKLQQETTTNDKLCVTDDRIKLIN